MTFYGKQPDEPVTDAPRTWTYTSGAGEERTVTATYINFMPEHVSFWLETGSKWDTLVLAEANHEVNHLREVA